MVEVEYLEETKTFSPQEISSMVLDEGDHASDQLKEVFADYPSQMKEVAEIKLGKKVARPSSLCPPTSTTTSDKLPKMPVPSPVSMSSVSSTNPLRLPSRTVSAQASPTRSAMS